MKKRHTLLVLLALAAAPLASFAQQTGKTWRIGFLGAGNVASNTRYLAAFRQGMAELRWVEGRDYVIDARYANNASQRAEELAAELVASQPDLLLTGGNSTIHALAQSTKTIPIVFGISADPVAAGFARSLQRPGANVTGMTNLSRELGPKRLEVIRDAFPGIAHVAVLFEPANAADLSDVKEIEQAAVRLRLRVTKIELRQASDIAPAFKRSAGLGIKAYMTPGGPIFATQSRTVADYALQFKIPGIAANYATVEAGGLMSYGPSADDNFRRAASYVDKIFKGAKPGNLPIEQPVEFELVVNMKTAKAMGLTIPQSILLRTDRVIE